MLDTDTDTDSAPCFLGPAELAAITADAPLIAALARGDSPDPADPLAARLVAWMTEVRG